MAGSGTLASLVGVVDNLDEATPGWNRASTIIALTLTFSAISFACILLRLYTRIILIKALGWDDIFVGLFLVSGAIGTVCLCLAPGIGFGQHFIYLTTDQKKQHFKLFYLVNTSFVTSTTFIKVSLLLQYLRIFKDGYMRLLCLATLSLTGLWGTVVAFMAWFPCFPVNAFWDQEITGAKCYGYGSAHLTEYYHTFLAQCIINMVLDLAILAMPIPLFFFSSTSRRTKIGLVALITMGLVVNIFATWRLQETIYHRATTYPVSDPTWYAPTLDMLGMLEVNFSCICASVPVFWPVLARKLHSASDNIFVTREIKVSVAHNDSDGDCEEDVELRARSSHSRGDSDSSTAHFSKMGSGSGRSVSRTRGGREGHYANEYIMDQVDPLRKKKAIAVESQITAGVQKRILGG